MSKRYRVIGVFLPPADDNPRIVETDVTTVTGDNVDTLTAGVIRTKNEGNNYAYVCTLNESGEVVRRAVRQQGDGKARNLPHDTSDRITVVACSLATGDALLFASEAGDAGLDEARELTVNFIEQHTSVAIQYVCTIDGRGDIVFTNENFRHPRR